MRILGFPKIDWINYVNRTYKLCNLTFTTWRFERRDKPYFVGEEVQIVVKPRTKDRIVLGIARFIEIEERKIYSIMDEEARADGFSHGWELDIYLTKERRSSKRPYGHPVYKNTLEWLVWYLPMIKFMREHPYASYY